MLKNLCFTLNMGVIMKFILIVATIVMALNTSAGEVLRMSDGYRPTCEKKYDEIRSKANNIYTLSNPSITVNAKSIKVLVEVKFLSCDKINGKYQFSTLENHMSATYQYPDFQNGGTITATRIDKKKEVLAISEASQIVGSSNILKLNGKHYVSIDIERSLLDINNFPAAQEKGNYFTTLMLRTQTKVITSEIDLGFSYVGSGSFRLFLNLETKKASF